MKKEFQDEFENQSKVIYEGFYCFHPDTNKLSGIVFDDENNLKVILNVKNNGLYFDGGYELEEDTYYEYYDVDPMIIKVMAAYITNQEFKINVDFNCKSEITVFEYVDGNDKLELIIDTNKGVYLINKIDFDYEQCIPTYVIKKLIESLKKAGYKKISITI